MSKKCCYTSVIIDVSIDVSVYEKHKNLTSFFEVKDNTVVDICCESMLQTYSHGGGCMYFFSLAANRPADYFILLKQDKSGKCAVDDLILALNWCIKHHVSLISLSMGTTHFSDAAKLYNIAQQLSDNGVCLVAAANNERRLTYPACFEYCIGVCIDYSLSLGINGFIYSEKTFDGIEIIINPYVMDDIFLGGNSPATAFFAGLLAKSYVSNAFVKDWLHKNSETSNLLDLHSYAQKALTEKYNDDVVTIVFEDMSDSYAESFRCRLQKIFNDCGYYCLSVYPNNNHSSTNFALFTHSYLSRHNSSYESYIALIIQLCQPSIIMIDHKNHCLNNDIDVILYMSNPFLNKRENTLMIDLKNCTPEEAYVSIVTYFNN